MARDFKLSGFTYTTAGVSTNVPAITAVTPTGDPANTGATLEMVVASGTSVGNNSDTKNVAGFLNSKIDTSSFANFIAGNEVTSVTNQPSLIGNTSYGDMYLTFNLAWNLSATAASNNIENGGYFVVEGAFDNGFGSADTSSFAPISAPVPLVIPSANLAAVALASNVFTCVAAHSLKVGDIVVFFSVTGLTGATAKRQMKVFSVPSPTSFTLTTTDGTSVSTISGTPTAGAPLYRCVGAALGGHRAACAIAPTRRPYMRLAFRYATALTTGSAQTLSVSRLGLTLGKDNAATY
jgi:hypothetical protein